MCHMVYVGLLAASDWWHSSGVKGPQVLDMPVGRPLMRSLDHLTLAWVGGGEVLRPQQAFTQTSAD